MTQEDADHELLSLELPEPLPRSELLDSFAKSSRRLILLGLLGARLSHSDSSPKEILPKELPTRGVADGLLTP